MKRTYQISTNISLYSEVVTAVFAPIPERTHMVNVWCVKWKTRFMLSIYALQLKQPNLSCLIRFLLWKPLVSSETLNTRAVFRYSATWTDNFCWEDAKRGFYGRISCPHGQLFMLNAVDVLLWAGLFSTRSSSLILGPSRATTKRVQFFWRHIFDKWQFPPKMR